MDNDEQSGIPKGRALARRDQVGPLSDEAYWIDALFLHSDHLRKARDDIDGPDQSKSTTQQPGIWEGVNPLHTGH